MFDKELTSVQMERHRLLENRAWLDDNFTTIQKEYGDQWIGILDRKVVFHDRDVEVVKRSVDGRDGEAVIMRIPVGNIPTPM